MEWLWSTILSTMPKHAIVLRNANVKLISVWSSIPATAPNHTVVWNAQAKQFLLWSTNTRNLCTQYPEHCVSTLNYTAITAIWRGVCKSISPYRAAENTNISFSAHSTRVHIDYFTHFRCLLMTSYVLAIMLKNLYLSQATALHTLHMSTLHNCSSVHYSTVVLEY